jgi:predicted O-linked N-acetylglucosamine transferase (SPINDLY family)/glycosyltransferase involved in cell wall biosynthesis
MKIAIFNSAGEYTLDTPYEKPLGGTESAICYFLEEMAIRGHESYLFNKSNEKIIRNVKHININNWYHYIKSNNIIFDIIIISCLPNELLQIKLLLNEEKTIFGLWTGHDIDQEASIMLEHRNLVDFVDLFIFVSDWQRIRYIDKFDIPYNKTLILRNGIGKPFEKYLNLPTNKIVNSMTYCSIPWRGLELLIPIFKKVKEDKVDASLKIFSGMNIYNQQENPGLFDEFKKIDSVECSYGISQTQLADELYNIDYLSYPNIFPETSCITVLQAMACGCLIVTSNLGALKETMGELNDYVDINMKHFDMNHYLTEFTIKQLKLMKLSHDEKEKLREKNRNHIRNNYLYSIICAKFEKDMEFIFINYTNFMLKIGQNLNQFIKYFSDNDFINAEKLALNLTYFNNLNNYYIIKLNQGVCYHKLGNNNKAIKYFKIAKSIKNNFEINKNIALVHLINNNILKFIKYAREAINFEFDPYFANIIAEKYDTLNMSHESMGLYKAIIDIEPDNINCLNNLGNIYLTCISDIDNFDIMIDETYGKALKYAIAKNENRKKELILSNIIFNNLYNWELTNEDILSRSRVWYNYFPKEDNLIKIANQLSRNKINHQKIRVGYISTDFITHPVGYMFDSILRNHNTNKFEIFCYDNSNQEKVVNDLIANKLRKYNNAKWKIIENKSDEEILNMIISDDLDILVDMMGHTRNTRMNILQYKPARILISYFAYPSTNGLDEIDYKFTDKYATPPETQKYYVEKLYYLPNGFQCYTPPIDINSVKDYTREKYKIHLCCFNNPIKLSKPTIETFAKILKKIPEAKLFLRYYFYNSSYLKQRILKQFINLGIEKERIDIGNLELFHVLEFYNKMDIILDPFPYNGGTISSEALYMNTPMITLAGSSYVSRVGVSLLSNIGLEKYIANSKEEYIQKVIDLVNNPIELKQLHDTLRVRMLNSDLANSVSFTSNIEIAYEDMVKKFNLANMEHSLVNHQI